MFPHLPREKSVLFGVKSKYLLQQKKRKSLDSKMLLHGALSHSASIQTSLCIGLPAHTPFLKEGNYFGNWEEQIPTARHL